VQHVVPAHRPQSVPLVPFVPVSAEAPRLHGGHRRRDALWRTCVEHIIRPFVCAADKVERARLRRAGFADVFVPTPMGPVHANVARGRGTLPPVTVIHGLASTTTDYGPLLRKLTESCERVVAIELPGHGRSAPLRPGTTEAQFMAGVTAALDRLLTTPTVIVGHSLGAYVATRYVAARPERARALVVVSPYGGPVDAASRRAYQQMFEVRSHHAAHAISRRTQPGLFYIHPAMNAATRLRFKSPSLQALMHSDLGRAELSPAVLRGLRVPTLLVWGDAERMVPQAHQRYFARNMPPGGRVEIVPGMNHAHPALGATPFVATLEAYLRRVRNGTAARAA
jgi:pimeloyl-ACP methyl ester carboxylesterase